MLRTVLEDSMRSVLLVVVLFSSLVVAEEAEKPSRWAKWESHVKIGWQTYANELTPDPGSAGLFGFLVGHRLSDRSMIGVSYAAASYQLGSEEELVPRGVNSTCYRTPATKAWPV